MNRTSALACCGLIGAMGVAAMGCVPYPYRYSSRRARSRRWSEPSAAEDEDADTDEGPPITAADLLRAREVAVLDSLDGQRVEVVGAVDVHEEPGDEANGLIDLRARAAQIGADAITSVETHPPAPGENVTHFSALAVRINDLLRGRPYVVIGEVDVDASMLHEDEAFEELRRRAREVHADLILGVRFDHGDGTAPLHLRGEAIRLVSQ